MNRRISNASFFAALLLFACGSGDPDGADPPRDEPAGPGLTDEQIAHLDEMVGRFVTSQGYPNIVTALIEGEEIVWQRGAGVGPAGAQKPGADTYFRAGWISSVVTATALLRLVDQGVLSLDDEAATWLPELDEVLSPPGGPAVTLRHLLSHQSGLPTSGYPGIVWDAPDSNLSEAELFTAIGGVELLFEPGTDHTFSLMGAVLAGRIIERASERSYRDFVAQEVLRPLGMKDSVWDRPTERLAPGHVFATYGGYQAAPPPADFGLLEPAIGLYSTARDLARFAAFGLGNDSLLARETLAESQRPQSAKSTPVGHGLGWLVVEGWASGTLVSQLGSTGDYGAFLGLHPERNLAAIVMSGTAAHGDLHELQSIGLAILSHLVEPDAGRRPEASLTGPAVVETVGNRLLALTTEPSLERIEETFDPGSLADGKADTFLDHFEQIAGEGGGCQAFELFEDRGLGAFVLHLGCERLRLAASVKAELEAPYRLTFFGINTTD